MAKKPPGKEKFRAPLKRAPKIIGPPSSRLLYLVMALVAVVILVGGYLFYYFQEQQMRQRIEGGLSIIAQLKVEQIAAWRAERLNDADILVGSPFFAEGVAEYMASPTDTEIKDKVIARLAIIEKAYPYQDILLTDVNGKVLLSLHDSLNRLSDMTLAQLSVAIKEHKAVITDFHYSPDGTSPYLDVVAPLFIWGQDSPQAIGAVVFCIDPSQYLYPLVQSSPMPSETAETLLVERDGDQVLFLNELRHQKDTALELKIPLSQQEVPSVIAVLGKEGVVEGKDYRGVEVLAAVQHVPDSPWYMVTKIDISEVLSTLRSRAGFIVASVVGLLAAVLALTGLVWQRRRRLAYQALYQAELETQALRSHFEYLVKYTNDIIILVDENQNIVEVNDRALEAYGYTREEMLGMPLAALIPPGDLPSYQARLRKIQQKGTIVAEGFYQRKDGSTFPAEISGRIIKIEDKTYLQGIIRDITERKEAEETLRESEENYRRSMDKSPLGIRIISGEGKVLYANRAVLDLYGLDSIKELRATPTKERYTPESYAEHQIRKEKRQRGEHVLAEYEISIIRKDGQFRHLQVIRKEVLWNGKTQYQSIYQDITERKEAEEALREEEEFSRSLITSARDGVSVLDNRGVHIDVNPALCEMTGFLREELIGVGPPHPYWPPEQYEEIDRAFQKTTAGDFADVELTFMRKNGERFPVIVSPAWIKDQQGNVINYFATVKDITEHKRAEEALKQSEEKYRTILSEIYEVYYELDLAGNYTFFNDALCRQTGHSRKELMGMNYRKYTPEDDWKSTYESFNWVYRTGKPMRWVPLRNIAKDGRIVYTEDTVLPLRNESGEVIGFRGVSRDVTERKMAEEERRQLELKAQITSRLASVGEMAAGVAHEINNPLTGVTGYAQLLMDREDVPSDIRSDLAAINDGARRVAGIVRTLLAFSRQTKPQQKLVDINELIESTLILRAYHLRVNNIEVVTRLATDVLETVADPGQIQQVLLNLIVNAEMEMKLARGKGKLTITTEKGHKTIKICVKDSGPGIKPEVMDRIFDPFFTTREVGQGTGLGLSLCYGIVTEHKGKIYAESQPGKGATFTVELPVVTEAKLLKPAKPVVKKSQKKVKARILVVDDEQVIRDVINRVLTGEGYKVETVDNAADALKKIESQKYKLILVDIKMPGMNGVELYKRIQKIDKSLGRRVVFMTGDMMGMDTEKFLSETKVAHIEKPFDAEQLSREVRRALTGGR